MTAFSPKGVVAGSFPRKPFKINELAGLLTYPVVPRLPILLTDSGLQEQRQHGAYSSGTVRDLHPSSLFIVYNEPNPSAKIRFFSELWSSDYKQYYFYISIVYPYYCFTNLRKTSPEGVSILMV